MKRIAILLCIAVLVCSIASAEGGMNILWQNTNTFTDTDGTSKEETVTVSIKSLDGVTIEQMETAEDNVADGYFAKFTKEGLAPVTVCITPACVGSHANLNEATDEQLQQYIDLVAEEYDNPASEIKKTEDGNVYLAVGTDSVRSVWTIYDDTTIEIIQCHDDYITPLTAEDQEFAVQILQGLALESTDGK